MNYTRLYDSIIDNARDRVNNQYTENHHILPKCLGGSNQVENLIRLSYKEHFICHWLLCKIYPENNSLKISFILMLGNTRKQNRVVGSREYSIVKSHIKDFNFSGNIKVGNIPWNKGLKGSQEAWNKGISTGPMSDLQKIQISETLRDLYKNKTHHRKGKSPWCSGTKGTGVVKAWNKGKQMNKSQCPFCFLMVDSLNMKRWHGDNCKKRVINEDK